MAKIPMGDFGNTTAQPGPRDRVNTDAAPTVDPKAYGSGIGAALEAVGTTGMTIAASDIATQQAEERRLAREREAEAKANAKEAARVKALTTTAQVVNGLGDLHDEIDNGLRSNTIDKSQAVETFTTKAEKLKATALENVDDAHRGLVEATLLDNLGKGKQQVNKMVQTRDRSDIMAGGLSYIEEMQRYAARGPKQADEAINNVRTFWTATGPMAGEDPAAAAKRVQSFVEHVRSRQASEMVNVDPRNAMKLLKNPDFLPEIDPDKRTTLIHAADTAVLRAENRAEIQAQAWDRKMEKEWKAVSTVFDAGKSLEPSYAADVLKKFKGTPYEASLRSMMADSPQNSAFASKPIATQTATLLELQGKLNTNGATPEDIKSYEQKDKAHKATLKDIKEDPYKAAAERGVITEITPLSLDLKQLPAQLAARAQAAQVVSTWTGKPESLFRPAEAAKVAEVLAALPTKDRAGAISGIAKTMTQGQMRAFAQQMGAKDDSLAGAAILAAQNAKTNSGRLVSELLLTGVDAQKEKRVPWPSGQSQENIRAEIEKLNDGAFATPSAQRAAGDVAFSIYAGVLAEGGTPSIKQAVNLATGGIMEMNGQKIIKPWGWTDGQVLKSLRDVGEPQISSLTAGRPVKVGGKDLTAAELAKLMPGAQLGPSPKPGAYTVSIGGRMVMAPSGKPLYVPLTPAVD
ncbi:MAG: hypothetical protein V4451_16925 [Pseudomonadota bacterium]